MDFETTDFAINIEVSLDHASTSKSAEELMSIIENADHSHLAEMIEYAFSTPRSKVVLTDLRDGDGNSIGELIISFAPKAHVIKKSLAR